MWTIRPVTVLLAAALLAAGGMPAPAQPAAKPRLLLLPWLVVDRTTNQDCTRPEGAAGPSGSEARRLAASAQAALDAEVHHQRELELIPRREWLPHWQALGGSRVVWQGAGCAVCSPAGELIRYDRLLVQQLALQTGADYVWLGITVAPLTPPGAPWACAAPPDDCCREALARERPAVLARSSILLVRARDGEVVWQRDARRLERDVPYRAGRLSRAPSARRAIAVDETAHLLGKAFRRERREALR